jgi:acyl carrier protein
MTGSSPTTESAGLVTEAERAMATLWQQVLNTSVLPGPTDNFFSLGGDSIAMIMVELRIKEEFSVDLPEGALLSTSSLRELAQLIKERS